MGFGQVNKEELFWLLALGIPIYFGSFFAIGLQPDAALYAGLSAKVLQTKEHWLLATGPLFPQYFEHPPYFFQWGAWVLKFLGLSDGAARAIGGIPSFFAYGVIIFWTKLRFGFLHAFATALLLALTTVYTKYAATSMLEAPLSLGVALCFVASYELHWHKKSPVPRHYLWCVLALGLMISTASKGVAGLGAWGGHCLSLLLACLFSDRSIVKLFFSLLASGLFLIFAAVPFALWAVVLYRKDGFDWFEGYIFDQVLRSFFSNRGEITHAIEGDPLYYLKFLFLKAQPWTLFVVTAMAAWVFSFRQGVLQKYPLLAEINRARSSVLILNFLAYAAAFIVPFSFPHFQLGHYVHPIFLCGAPVGAFVLIRLIEELVSRQPRMALLSQRPMRWGFVGVLFVILLGAFSGPSRTTNRGQEFAKHRNEIRRAPSNCEVLAPGDEIDAYLYESFGLWYFGARPHRRISYKIKNQQQVPDQKIYFSPRSGIALLGRGCRKQEL